MATFVSTHENNVLSKVLSLALSIQVLGCSSSRTEQPIRQAVLATDVAPGVVVVDVLESGHPEHYWQYQVQPTTGWVRQLKEERFQDVEHENIPHTFHEPAGAIEACAKNPEASSVDGEYLAYCTGSGSDEFFIADKKTKAALYHWKPEKWRKILGFAWAPNSHSVAFLNISSYYGKSPVEIISALSGHPVSHDTVFLDVVEVRTTNLTEYVIRKDVPYSFARILDWSE